MLAANEFMGNTPIVATIKVDNTKQTLFLFLGLAFIVVILIVLFKLNLLLVSIHQFSILINICPMTY